MKKKLTIGIFFVIALLFLIIAFTELNIRPIILTMAESRVRAIALDAVNMAIASTIQDVRYEELVTLSVDAHGRVTALSANTIALNGLAAKTGLTAQQYIEDIEMQPIRVSLGSATGFPLFTGRGPSVLVHVEPVGSVSSEFLTEFMSAGINQTRHRIYMRLSTKVRIVIPTGAKLVEVITMVPVAETLIVGEVPHTYVEVPNTLDALNLLPD
ncbi:MAG: sporulation protein YunB [Christensenellaceae bacterium]|nr:sporulation protein YunB [Christensenellaceae bacterium]